MRFRFAVVLGLALASCNKSGATASKPASGSGVTWQSYADGLAQAHAEDKPVLVVVSAEWCPHCRNYQNVFRDPQVISAAKDFVLVHVDADREPEVASRFRVDGTYIPRTYFLGPDGAIEDVQAQNPRYHYFYDERNPASILGGMTRALAVTKGASGEAK